MNDEIKIEFYEDKLHINVKSNNDVISVHVWSIDSLNNKNESRIYMSGWTKLKQMDLKIESSGTYYARLFNKKTGKSIISEKIYVPLSELLLGFSKKDLEKKYDSLSINFEKKYDDLFKKAENNERLMQKMFIVGGTGIVQQLKLMAKNRKISLFALDYHSIRIANMIFSQEFFDNRIKIENFFSKDRINTGYFISVSYRKKYEPLDSNIKNLSSDDILVLIDDKEKLETEQRDLLIKNGVEIVSFTDIVNQSIINKVLVNPLKEVKDSGNQVIYVHFPTSKGIKNKSDMEKIAAKTSIKQIRNNIKNGIYPIGLKILNMDESYMEQVISGWTLNSNSIDTLKNKKTKFVNIQDGHRVIPDDQNQKSDRIIYLFGNSVMYGIGSDDRNNLPSLLSELLKNNQFNYTVKNMANFSMNDYIKGTDLMKSINFKKEDIIIFGSHEPMSEIQKGIFGGEYIDMMKYFERPHDLGEVFLDMTHLNKNGYSKMATELYNYMLSKNLVKKK